MNKTVYILGAGFSIDAGSPPQKDIIKGIFTKLPMNSASTLGKAVLSFKSFLSKDMHLPDELHNEIPLEDVFTPLDRCLADGLSYRGLSVNQVAEMRVLIYDLIGKTFDKTLKEPHNDYIQRFAKHIVEKCSHRKNKYKKVDPVAVISTNWDILLDNAIHDELKSNFCNEDKRVCDGVVDYCCHISSYKEDDPLIMPGLEKLGQGGFNVKLLKLHGSLNWLLCPRCQRVYIDFNEKIAVNQSEIRKECRHCNKNFRSETLPLLISNMTMPTFLKNFTNTQYKLIWQNAGIELSEASKIVFIGYSLPYADFELRQLLSRMVGEHAEITVVDFAQDDDLQKIEDTTTRYRTFFGDRFKGPIFHKGAKQYIMESKDFD